MTELCFTGARRLARLIRSRKLSAAELMRATIAQIERVNPKVNAIVTFLPERALAQAKALDRRLARPRTAAVGPLAGLPIAYKDLLATKGIRTTKGSPIFADTVPDADAALVERLGAAGAITLGKTNTPEFGAGSQTFNAVFGATRNPYDPTKTCGGSSGGAAVALACGMLPIADGSDLGGSLRNPANFCNVVGFRPTPGRVPAHPSDDAWDTMSVLGPMARSVEDTAFLLSAMAGPDPRAPVTLDAPGRVFARSLKRDFRGVRVAWSTDLGGLPIDRRIRRVLETRRRTFEALGCIVEDATPELDGADEVFQVLRAVAFATKYAPLLESHRDQLKDTVVWNIEAGLRLDAARIARAVALRSKVYHALRTFMQRYAFLLAPVSQVPPFPVEQPYVSEIEGAKLETYIDWMKVCFRITSASHPAISVPAGFTDDDPPLPVGIQIIGRYRDDFGVLQLAHAFEQATRFAARRPPLAA
ncbi:MAG: amidase [Burkholderiales bacterium]|nr:amidase [Burkholderiales bacterium]